jgi:hypothetical protein
LAKIRIIEQNAFIRLDFDAEDIELSSELAGPYWASAHKFICELTERDYRELSSKQIIWATKLKEQLEMKRRTL